jgi:hypothetical protein
MKCQLTILAAVMLIAGCRVGSPPPVVVRAASPRAVEPAVEKDASTDSETLEPECARGSAPEIYACQAASCATKVHDATPSALRALGWRILQCDEPRGDGEVLSSGEGHASLYRAADHELTFAADLTHIGGTAKYYNAATFKIASATTRKMQDGREVLWLRWSLNEQTGGGALDGTLSMSTTKVTICRTDVDALRACAEALIESSKTHFYPWNESAEMRESTFSEQFDIELAGDGVDVKLLKVVDSDVNGDAKPDAQAGHHAL